MAQRGTKAKIDLVELERLAAMQPTDDEIAAFFGVSPRTVYRRKRVKRFAEAIERGKAKGRLSIRRHQLKMLEAGNAVMGIWLGKQHLGQTDQIFHEINSQVTVVVAAAVEGPDRLAEFDGVTIEMRRALTD